MIRTVDFYKNQFDSISGKVRYATNKANRDDDVYKNKSTVDTVLDTAHAIADALDGLDD